jgi:hypothetical protein
LYYCQIHKNQVLHLRSTALALETEQLGSLPLINHFLEYLDLEARMDRFVPTHDRQIRLRQEIQGRIEEILSEHKAARYLVVEWLRDEQHHFRQARRGRPGPNTRYVRKIRKFWRFRWRIDEKTIAYDCNSEGMYPWLLLFYIVKTFKS